MILKELLKEKGITMYRLAKESKIGNSTINEICNGKRKEIRLKTATKIAEALNISVEELNKYLS